MSRDKFDTVVRMLEEQFGPNVREVNSDHWLIEIGTRRRRSQLVHVRRDREGSRGDERLIAESPVGPWRKRYDAESLLRRNAELDVGAICVEELEDGGSGEYLVFRASRLLETADELEVWEMVQHVARVADELESDIYAFDKH